MKTALSFFASVAVLSFVLPIQLVFADSIVATIPVGDSPYGELIVNDELYITNLGDDTVSVIDTRNNNAIEIISVGDFPFGIVEHSGSISIICFPILFLL